MPLPIPVTINISDASMEQSLGRIAHALQNIDETLQGITSAPDFSEEDAIVQAMIRTVIDATSQIPGQQVVQ